MSNDLIKSGCTKSKTDNFLFPKATIVSSELRRHFVRGYFDGDGTLSMYPVYKDTDKEYIHIKFSLCGTREFLESLVIELNESIDSHDFKYTPLKRHTDSEANHFYVNYGGRLKTLAIANWMYDGATISLERKQKRYEKIRDYKQQLEHCKEIPVEPNGDIRC